MSNIIPCPYPIPLLIPFELKDELKAKYNTIQWYKDEKIWKFVGKYDIPADLRKYRIKEIDVPYDEKDIMKEKYKSMRWNQINKTWMISQEDYDKFMAI